MFLITRTFIVYLLCVWHSTHLIFMAVLWAYYYYSHFRDAMMETQMRRIGRRKT